MSNEHPDMHGNWMDAPFLCHLCERDFREDNAYGAANNDELLFCSAECAAEWDEAHIEAFYGD